MDWTGIIEKNQAALKRILAGLVAMAGLDAPFTSPLWGGRREASGGGCDRDSAPTRRSDDRRPPLKGEADSTPTLPRHRYLAVLRLLRPAESAARRLVVVAARGLVVTLPPSRPRQPKPKPKTRSAFLTRPGGTGIWLPPGARPLPRRAGAERGGVGVGREPRRRPPALPLFDPLRRPFRRPAPPRSSGVPRISVPGWTTPFPVPVRRPPAPDDAIDLTRLARRLAALAAALDDLPAQAKRLARWKARRDRSMHERAGSEAGQPPAPAATPDPRLRSGGAAARMQGGGGGGRIRTRRIWPLRFGRPPGQSRANGRKPEHEVHACSATSSISPMKR